MNSAGVPRRTAETFEYGWPLGGFGSLTWSIPADLARLLFAEMTFRLREEYDQTCNEKVGFVN
jgi:hypothetical protein